MKLKCDTHGRRVLSVSNSPHLLHRTGDKSQCGGKFAIMLDTTSHITRKFVVMAGKHFPKQFTLEEVSCNKEQRPHTNRNKG